jgi:hypothetical protein
MTSLNTNSSAGFDPLVALEQLDDEIEGWLPEASPNELVETAARLEEALADLLERVREEIASRSNDAADLEEAQFLADLEAA